jgi:hypothetical protein
MQTDSETGGKLVKQQQQQKKHEKENTSHRPILYLSRTQLFSKNTFPARCWWLTPVILATQEAEIRKITV